MSDTMELYNGQVLLKFNDLAHRYQISIDDGYTWSYKQGVTTILRLLAKDGLIQWAANMVTDHIRINCTKKDGVYQVDDDCLKLAKYAHSTKRDAAGDVGKQVHKWLEDHIKGHDGPVSVQMRPSIEAFLEWEAGAKPEYLASERVCYSLEHDFCGTTDTVMLLDGKRTVLDFKTGKPDGEWKSKRYTGKKRARTEHFLQDAFYDIAITEEDGEKAEQYAVLYLPLDGNLYCYTTNETELLRELALSVLKTSRLLQQANFKNQYN